MNSIESAKASWSEGQERISKQGYPVKFWIVLPYLSLGLLYQALSADITKPLIDADDEALKNRITQPTGPRRTSEKDFYPDRAKRAGVQGEVLLVYVLEATGRVSNVQILRSSGSTLLDPAAIQSIRHTAFARSLLLDGTPVRAFLTTRTFFQLANSAGEVTPNKSLERSRDD